MLLLLLACAGPEGADTAEDLDGDGIPDAQEDPVCDAAPAPDTIAGPDCVTDTIACGDELEATTEGGSSAYVGDDYTHSFCFVNVYNHTYAGNERVYALELPADVTADVTLEAPCADVDLAVLLWPDTDRCPTYDDGVAVCEGDDQEGDDAVSVSWGDEASRWLVVVEPKLPADTPFRLRVECR